MGKNGVGKHTMSACGTDEGATHYTGCACHEARWEARLAEAQAHAAEYRKERNVAREMVKAQRRVINEIRKISEDWVITSATTNPKMKKGNL